MSSMRASTPSSTTGSTAGSPPASQPPPTPLSPTESSAPSPQTPVEPSNPAATSSYPAGNAPPASGPAKRKPSRRANTAERRATHNAVERQRRETLNGRFLDLAALLPNLATVRRPSKSAIVNSSIAIIHSNRRQRLLAARELRLLKIEADALRRELNEWRDRSGLPRVDEPARAPEFLDLLGLGDGPGGEGEGGDAWWDTARLDEMGEEERKAYELVIGAQEEDEDGMLDGGEEDDYVRAAPAPTPVTAKAPQHILPRGVPQGIHPAAARAMQQQQHHQVLPAIASPTTLTFDSTGGPLPLHGGVHPHVLYEPSGHPHPHSHALPVHPGFSAMQFAGGAGVEHDKVAAWSAQQLYSALSAHGGWHNTSQQQQQQQHQALSGLFSPPGTAGGTSSTGGASPAAIANPFANPQTHAFLAGLQQQQQHQQQMQMVALGHGHVYASPEMDDASSVSSVEGGVGAARSLGGSPQPHGAGAGFDLAGATTPYGRKPSLSLSVPTVGGQWTASQPQPISAGGGGGGGRHFAAMGMF